MWSLVKLTLITAIMPEPYGLSLALQDSNFTCTPVARRLTPSLNRAMDRYRGLDGGYLLVFALPLEEPMEQVTLMEVKDDGQTLVLIDGKELHVDPRAITTAIRWLPSTLLEISETDTDPLFELRVKVYGANEEIRASWRLSV
jgi:hypothetical protein